MKIDIKYDNPTYVLELSQEEFLVLFEALGDRTDNAWDSYKEQYALTQEELKNLQNVSLDVYEKMNKIIKKEANSSSGEFFTSDRWLAKQYKESYKD